MRPRPTSASPRLLLSLGLALGVAACSRGKLEGEDDDDGDLPETIDPGEVEDACEDGELQSVELTVTFEESLPPCPWEEEDNLAPAQGVVTARVEQWEELAVPDPAIVCGLEFDFTAIEPGESTTMVYDDNFLFTFGDVVIAGSYAPMVELLETDGLGPLYVWEDLAGQGFDFDPGTPTFCLGETEGLSTCTIPPPETPGEMSLAFPSAVVNELSARAYNEDRYEFGFVTIGDNDPALDCSHAELAFTVTVDFVSQL